jgi:sodium-dependent dicarboxylate transporter 2/3/5
MNDQIRKAKRGSPSASAASVGLAKKANWVDGKKHFWMFAGVALFTIVCFCPPFPDAVDPEGTNFVLTHQGEAALALLLPAATWWVFEVVPIGVTSITFGAIQVLFLNRPP